MSVVRPFVFRARYRAARHPSGVAEAIETIRTRWDIPDATDDPVLIFSSGWRSGSTLLQRLVTSSGRVLVWGEPWNRTDTIPRLAESLRPLTDGWPHHAVFIEEVVDDPDQLRNAWIANLFPSAADLIESHRALFRTLFAHPAQRAGFDRWGIKVVRLGVEAIAYLRFLFPLARIVFIVRNPYESWASYRRARIAAFERFPSRPVFGAVSFGRVWAEHVSGVLDGADRHDVLCLRYEDLIDPTEAMRHTLERHLDLLLDWSVLDSVVGSASDRETTTAHLFAHERSAISWTTNQTASRLGYVAR